MAEAKQYLSTQAFSQQGLIDQLDSSAGGGYSVNDATVAVDSLTVDWNAEAVQAAKEYLKTQPFSCTDLINNWTRRLVTSTQSLRLRMERRRQATARASAVRVAITPSLRQNEDHTSNTQVAGSTIARPKGDACLAPGSVVLRHHPSCRLSLDLDQQYPRIDRCGNEYKQDSRKYPVEASSRTSEQTHPSDHQCDAREQQSG